MKLLGVAGSLREDSYNAALLRAACDLTPPGVVLEAAGVRGVPLYDADLERDHGLPEAVTVLKDRIAAADGLILFTPEYNNSIPGVFKNAVDWLSRPASDIPRVFGARPVAVLGASAGGFGTILSQNAWLPVLRTLGTRPWFGGRMTVARAGGLFDEEGRLTDEATRERLAAFVAGFAAFVDQSRRPEA